MCISNLLQLAIIALLLFITMIQLLNRDAGVISANV